MNVCELMIYKEAECNISTSLLPQKSDKKKIIAKIHRKMLCVRIQKPKESLKIYCTLVKPEK